MSYTNFQNPPRPKPARLEDKGKDAKQIERDPEIVKASLLKQLFYSASKDAVVKLQWDGLIGALLGVDKVDWKNPEYLRLLIPAASNGAVKVKTDAPSLQFFLIRAGAEGFLELAEDFAQNRWGNGGTVKGQDAGQVVIDGDTWDLNELLAVFSPTGELVSAAPLARPLILEGRWTLPRAKLAYKVWDQCPVKAFFNESFPVKYVGLAVYDAKGYRASHAVDFHKAERSDGCIFVLDPKTPSPEDLAKINAFEPELIVDVLAAVGVSSIAAFKANKMKGLPLGTMRIVNAGSAESP